jgi:hypothetical protein
VFPSYVLSFLTLGLSRVEVISPTTLNEHGGVIRVFRQLFFGISQLLAQIGSMKGTFVSNPSKSWHRPTKHRTAIRPSCPQAMHSASIPWLRRKTPENAERGHFASVQVLKRFDFYDLSLLFGCCFKTVSIALLVCHNADDDTVVVNSERESVT